MNKYVAELIGTFWLVLGGCGAAVLAAGFAQTGIGQVGVALAFGLSLLAMGFAIGHISGCHLNPAVTVGLWAGGRFAAVQVVPYIVMQVIGAIAAAAVLHGIANGQGGWQPGGFASNGFGELSPGHYAMGAVFVCEMVMTAMLVFVIMGATDARAPAGFAPIAIGLCLTLIYLVITPVSNASVNPARSTGVALYAQTAALSQLWLFWLAPIIGGAIGGLLYKLLAGPAQRA